MNTAPIRRAAIVALPAMLWSAAAHAHVGVQAVAVVAGALHPWITPACALVLVALVLWQCQLAASTDLMPFGAFGFALAAGVLLGLAAPARIPAWTGAMLAVALAMCVALAWRPPHGVWLALHVGGALLAGIVAGADAAPDVESPALFAAGVLAGGLVVPLIVAIALVERTSPVAKIGLRVAGSWVAALALIAAALQVAGRAG